MKIKLLTEEDYKTTLWSGGKTTQIAIYPFDSNFSQKDFIWRISSATVETDKSDFTVFNDYQRYIATLDGKIKLTHNGDDREYSLNEYELHKFDGAVNTVSVGKCTDYNLMLRKGKAEAEIYSFNLKGDGKISADIKEQENKNFVIIFCAEGCVKFNGTTKIEIPQNKTLILEDYTGKFEIKPLKNSKVIYQNIIVHK